MATVEKDKTIIEDGKGIGEDDLKAAPLADAPPPVYSKQAEPSNGQDDVQVSQGGDDKAQEAPPSTSNGKTEEAPPPDYAFPTAFVIGGGRTVPLVSAPLIKGHLALLNAFAELRKSVEGLDDPKKQPVQPFPADKEIRWTWFVSFAVDRFAAWCQSTAKTPDDYSPGWSLPPLDVLMVWHSYMLNPGWYSEDCMRIPKLQFLSEVSEELINALPNMQKVLSEPPVGRQAYWELKTGRPFDPFEDARKTTTKEVRCPACVTKFQHPYMNATGTGYLQQKFEVYCPSCSQLIKHSTLGARKLAEDLATPASAANLGSYLAGTLRTSDYLADSSRGQRIKDTILLSALITPSPALIKSEHVKFILINNKYSLETMRATLISRMRPARAPLVGRIISAYTNGEIFSVDLVGAVIRQGSFVEKMHDLKWTEPGYFDDPLDEVALQHCIARYHAFLDLMSSSPAAFFVPTLDIDLAWHTHQLLGTKYNTDCKNLVGRYIDHDDKIEEDTLASAFDVTCRAWKNRFQVQYMHCGCPIPGETIGQRLSKFVSGGAGHKSYLVPPSNKGDDLSVLAATHPSDHNSVFDSHRKGISDSKREKRREKRRKRLLRDKELANKGKLDKAYVDRGYAHESAFLYPIPLWYYTPIAYGCAAYAGGVVNSGGACGGCAAGAGGCGVGGSACGGSK